MEAYATVNFSSSNPPLDGGGVFFITLKDTEAQVDYGYDKARASANEAGSLVAEAAASHEPILITGKRTNAVLISEDDWRTTPYLLSIPGMRESIREGLQTPVEKCARELDW